VVSLPSKNLFLDIISLMLAVVADPDGEVRDPGENAGASVWISAVIIFHTPDVGAPPSEYVSVEDEPRSRAGR